jgi:glycosyltransferase involved in cell wall biosynthesis
MKIAMIGQKGIPATFGGVERHVEEIGARLAELGHEVVVYTRPNYTEPGLTRYRGMTLVSLPTVDGKHLDATVHSLEAACATWTGGFDVVHFHAIGPALMSPIAKVRGRKVVVTIHGQDWRRQKWGRVASMALQAGEWAALNVPDATISVSKGLADRYAAEGHDHVTYIPNGVTIAKGNDGGYLRELGLKPRRYILFAGRLVPEKGVDTLIAAHARLGETLPLVIAGGSSHSDDYVAKLREAAAGRDVLFLGNVYGRKLATLFRNAGLFVLPSDLEGQPIVLLEALAYGAPIVASDIPENLEVLGDQGLTFRVRDEVDLAEVLDGAIADIGGLVARAGARRDRALREYDWSAVAGRTLEVYQGLVRRPHGVEERARAALVKGV